jgi:segregation and condensation protein A
LFAMQELDLEIASEFLVMAATLLHIKSRMLLPDKKEKPEEIDPREELILRLIEYKKYKEVSVSLRLREKEWDKLTYKLPEVIEFLREDETLELSPEELKRVYSELLEKNKRKMNNNVGRMAQIIQHEKVSLRSKIREIIKELLSRTSFVFSDLFSLKAKSKTEVVTGFLAILELSKLKKVKLEQQKQFADILIHRTSEDLSIDDEKIAAEV